MKTFIRGAHPALASLTKALGLGEIAVTDLELKFSAREAAKATVTFLIDVDQAEGFAKAVETAGITIDLPKDREPDTVSFDIPS